MKSGILFDELFLDHECIYQHPENPRRLDAVVEGLMSTTCWKNAIRIKPRPAIESELQRVHSETYIQKVLSQLNQPSGFLDPDTFFSKGSKNAALNACGGGIDLVQAVHDQKCDWGFALVRPPGHHATRNKPGGFCIFNNIGVAAASLLARKDVKRVAIFDWDVHHGNGTQNQFYNNPDVLFFSLHQWPHFPGSGLSEEIGGEKAKGTTVNFPFPSGVGDADFLKVIDTIFEPVATAFQPDHILVSAGFDGHKSDPLAGLELSTEVYATMSAKLKCLANKLCNGRISLFLEGGYNLATLTECAKAVVHGMENHQQSALYQYNHNATKGDSTIQKTLKCIQSHWPKLE